MDLARSLAAESEMQENALALSECEFALSQCNNDADAARKYLLSSRPAALRAQSDEGVDADVIRGLYRDDVTNYQLNMQTGEVYLHNRVLIPTPGDILAMPSFKAAARASISSEMPFCSVVSNTTQRRHIRIVDTNDMYEIIAWKPLISNRGDNSGLGEGAELMNSHIDEKGKHMYFNAPVWQPTPNPTSPVPLLHSLMRCKKKI